MKARKLSFAHIYFFTLYGEVFFSQDRPMPRDPSMPQDPLMTGDPLDAVKPVETAYYLPPSPTYHYDKIPQLDGFAEYDPENNPQQELISWGHAGPQ